LIQAILLFVMIYELFVIELVSEIGSLFYYTD